MRRLIVGLFALGGLALAACFSDRSAGPVAGECQVPVSVIDSMHFVVAIRGFAFHPDSLKVPPGATVTWVDCEDVGQVPHTTTSVTAVWSSPSLVSGQRYSHTFPAGGTFPYSCTIHPYMLGKVVVQ
jgi:plastocyanin